MTKKNHRIRNSIKTFFEKHTDPDQHEKMKETRKDMEEKKKKLLDLVGNKEENDDSKGLLSELIEDFHKQYESLFSRYDNLTGKFKEKVSKPQQEKENLSSSSESETDSDNPSKEKSSKNGKVEGEMHEAADGTQQELEAAKLEIADLKNQLAEINNVKTALDTEYKAVITKLQDSDRIAEDLKAEVQRIDSEKSEILAEKEELKLKLETSAKTEAELSQKIEELTKDRDNLATEKEDAIKRLEGVNQNVEDLKGEVDKLQSEKRGRELELETIGQDISKLRLELDSSKQETEDLKESMKVAEEEKQSLSLKITQMSDELKQAQNTMEELKAESNNSKERLAEREVEFSSLRDMHDAHTTEASAKVKALEEQANSLKLELETLMSDKRDKEEQFESKSAEARQLSEEVAELRAVKSQLEEQIAGSSNEASAQIKSFQDQISSLEEEIKTLHFQEREMKLELERKAEDIADYRMQVEGLNERLTSSDELLKQFYEEKEALTAKLLEREQEVETLSGHKTGLEEQHKTRSNEVTQLTEEVERLQDRIQELEKALHEKEDESSSLQRRLEDGENEASSKVAALMTELSNLKQESEEVQTIKNQLEAQIEKEKEGHFESLNILETENAELKHSKEDLLRKVKELEDELNNRKEQCEQLELRVQEREAELSKAESMTREIKEDLGMNSASKDEKILELEVLVEDLKRDYEEAKDDEKTAYEKLRTIEVQLRLANQKLRVTEQVLSEKEESFKFAEMKHQEECQQLEDRLTRVSQALAAHQGMITDISANLNKSLTGMESQTRKFEEDYTKFSNNISNLSEEVQILKHCAVGKNVERKELKEQVSNLTERLNHEREQALKMREKIGHLEVEVESGKGEKEKLIAAVSELKKTAGDMNLALKERDEQLTTLGEEKRQAIRQLCLWYDNVQAQNDELKKIISKKISQRGKSR